MADYLDPTYRAQQEPAAARLPSAPTNAAAISLPERAFAFANNAVEGIPVVGPALQWAGQAAATLARPVLQGIAGGPVEPLNFQAGMAERRDYDQRLDEALPGTALAGNIAGAVAGSIPYLLAAPSLFGLGGGSTAARVGASVAGNTAIGAADMAVRTAMSPGGFNPGAVGLGAGVGAVGGALGPLIASGATTATNAAVNWLRTTAGAAAAGLDRDVFASLQRAFQADNLGRLPVGGVTAVEQRLIDLGPEGMLMDAGPALRAQGTRIAAGGDEAAETVQQPLWVRQSGAPGRMTTALAQALGQPQDVQATFRAFDNAAFQNAQPLYSAAYNRMLPGLAQMPDTRAALNTAVGRQAWDRAARLAEAEGFAIYPDAPTVRALDLWQRELADMARAAGRTTEGTGPNAARVFGDLRSRVLAEVDAAVPEFAAARAAYAGPMAMADAMAAGLDAFNTRLTLPDLQFAFNTMSPTEQQTYAMGALAAVRTNLESAVSSRLQATEFFSYPQNVAKLRFLIGNQATLDLVRVFGAESSYAVTEAAAGRRITAAANTAAREEISPPVRPLDVRNVTATGVLVAAPVVGALRSAAASGNLATAAARRTAMAEVLTMGPGPERDQVVRALLENTPRYGTEWSGLNLVIGSLATGGTQLGERALTTAQ